MSLMCAILVVCIHTTWIFGGEDGLGRFVREVIGFGAAQIAVPFFFIVSGFFLAQHFDEEGWWMREVKKRISSLVIPFFVWSFIAFVGTTSLSLLCDVVARRALGSSVAFLQPNFMWDVAIGARLTCVPLLGPLWFVRCLFVFILLSGVLKFFVLRFKWWYLLLLFVLNLGTNHIPNDLIRDILRATFGSTTNGLLYFSLGIYLCYFPMGSKRNTKFGIVICGIIVLVLLAVRVVIAYKGWPFDLFTRRLLTPFLLYFVWSLTSVRKWPDYLTACSFPIFLMHMVFMPFINTISAKLHLYGFCFGMVGFAGSMLLSIVVTLTLRRFMPRVARFLFGGR
jgi:peptidoglycan/LPS O-acetylase OafA/YrhL